MWDNDVFSIIAVDAFGNDLFKKVKIVVIDIKIDSRLLADSCYKGIVDDLFMCAKLVEQEENLKRLLKIGIGNKKTFARNRAYYAFLLQFLINALNGIP